MNRLVKAVVLALTFALPAAAASTPDALITSKAKLSLWTTGGVRSQEVHVDTTEGIVTLYGKVPTAALRGLAQNAVAPIEGVKSVENRLAVKATG